MEPSPKIESPPIRVLKKFAVSLSPDDLQAVGTYLTSLTRPATPATTPPATPPTPQDLSMGAALYKHHCGLPRATRAKVLPMPTRPWPATARYGSGRQQQSDPDGAARRLCPRDKPQPPGLMACRLMC